MEMTLTSLPRGPVYVGRFRLRTPRPSILRDAIGRHLPWRVLAGPPTSGEVSPASVIERDLITTARTRAQDERAVDAGFPGGAAGNRRWSDSSWRP